jgi:hypothetical protein
VNSLSNDVVDNDDVYRGNGEENVINIEDIEKNINNVVENL